MKNKLRKIDYLLFFWIILFWTVMAVDPVNRHDWLMENILFLIFFSTLIFTYKFFRFSIWSYFLITAFFTLHLIGAHYTYSEVPFGFYLSKSFELSRNHFDRIVHFSFGFLLVYPIKELLTRSTNIKGFSNNFLSLNIVLASSSFFELIEWLFVSVVNPELGEAYLGTQGDVWDAQQDMALALLGATITLAINYFFEKMRSNPKAS